MKVKYAVIIGLSLFFLTITDIPTKAVSGACSWHDGVDCSRGRQYNGKVYCNDGWTDSMAEYDFMVKCENQRAYDPVVSACVGLHDFNWIDYEVQQRTSLMSSCMEKNKPNIRSGADHAAAITSCSEYGIQQSQRNTIKECTHRWNKLCSAMNTSRVFNHTLQKNTCACNSDFYWDEITSRCMAYFNCQMILNAYLGNDGQCYCDTGYEWKETISLCTKKSPSCSHIENSYLGPDNKCYCNTGYRWEASMSKCLLDEKKQQATKPKVLGYSNDGWSDKEAKLVEFEDKSLISRIKGQILLQVEEHGEAWYVDPDTLKKYYMKDGPTAYEMMRSFGLGITDADLEKIPIEGSSNGGEINLVNRLKGKILLQVQQNGEAWYVHPINGKRYYLKNGLEAYRIMRELGLGITNKDLRKVFVGKIADIRK